MRYKVTPTLINSFLYGDDKQVRNYLIGEKLERNKLMQRGVDFEEWILRDIQVGAKQVEVWNPIQFSSGVEVWIRGYIDLLLPDKIVDIKTVRNDFNVAKNCQHILYPVAMAMDNFEYWVYNVTRDPFDEDKFKINWRRPLAFTADEKAAQDLIARFFGYIYKRPMLASLYEAYCERPNEKRR